MEEKKGSKNVVGPRLKQLREGMQFSQKNVVEMLNERGHSMTPSTVSKIEMGKRGVSDIELQSFSIIYKCTVNDLYS